MQSILNESNIFKKLDHIEQECHQLLLGHIVKTPQFISRDVEVIHIKKVPPKQGLSSNEGQARLLHDLANIELQAMELGIRSLHDYPNADPIFREQLVKLTLEEAYHLKLCLTELQNLGFQWGDWPVHTMLWDATDINDSLLDRILIVHRYLEGSGLDASEELLKKLSGLVNKEPRRIVGIIAHDEVGHVQFGSNWFKQLCQNLKLDSDHEFKKRINSLNHKLPKRSTKLNHPLRLKAGFSENEIASLEDFQNLMVNKKSKKPFSYLKRN